MTLELAVADPDFRLWLGDVREVLRELPDASMHTVVTSPPYWGMRDYKTGSWEGGDPACDHLQLASGGNPKQGPNKGNNNFEAAPFKERCGKCGARRVDQQIGLEPTPEAYIETMTEVFEQVRRVLRSDGTCWLVIADSFSQGGGPPGSAIQAGNVGSLDTQRRARDFGMRPKNLVGIPWRLALSLQAAGWYLRCDVIWSKPNPMPESVTDRPSSAHEYVFLLSRSQRYFYDADAIRAPHARLWDERNGGSWAHPDRAPAEAKAGQHAGDYPLPNPSGRNCRSVWEIAIEPYSEAHFATFPQALVERCVLAATSARGVCPDCEAPWRRCIEVTRPADYDPAAIDLRFRAATGGRSNSRLLTKVFADSLASERTTVGWRPGCDCYEPLYFRDFPRPRGRWQRLTWFDRVRRRAIPERFGWPVVPATVFDPFMGSGTTAIVARRLGRRAAGIELNPEYAALAWKRTQQLSLFAQEEVLHAGSDHRTATALDDRRRDPRGRREAREGGRQEALELSTD